MPISVGTATDTCAWNAVLSILASTFSQGQELIAPSASLARSVDVGVGGRDRERPADRRPGLALGVRHQHPGRHRLFMLATVFLAADRGACGARNFDVANATTVTGGVFAPRRGESGAEHVWTATTTSSLFAAAGCRSRRSRQSRRVLRAARTRGPVKNRTLWRPTSRLLHVQRVLLVHLPGDAVHQQVLRDPPTKTGAAWPSTSVTASIASAIAGARLVALVGVCRLLVTGLSLLAIAMFWLDAGAGRREPRHRLLPAFLVAGVGDLTCAPSAQIGALSGVLESTSGPASGLVETMREIGGAGRRRARVDRARLPSRPRRLPRRVRSDLRRSRDRGRRRGGRLPASDRTAGRGGPGSGGGVTQRAPAAASARGPGSSVRSSLIRTIRPAA